MQLDMALQRHVPVLLQDENSELCRGKNVAKDFTERKILSNITNKLKGPATSQAKKNNAGKKRDNISGHFVPSRAPLVDISNTGEKSLNLNKPNATSWENKGDVKGKLESWAKEGIERVHFSGKDMEALSRKNREEEINKNVEMALSYKSEIPYMLPRAFEKDPPMIKDCLDLDDTAGLLDHRTPLHGMKSSSVPSVDYETEENICGMIVENISRNWNPLVKEIIG